jgi:hypothetical protein
MDWSDYRKILARRGAALWTLINQFQVFWGISTLISVLLLLVSLDTLFAKSPAVAGSIQRFRDHMGFGWTCLSSLLHLHLNACGELSQSTVTESVPPTSFAVGFIQIAGVLCITRLWFLAFRADAKKLVFLSLIPTLVVTVAMFKAYQPAVLVAAFIAIYVAAEHYNNLKAHEKRLGESLEELKRVKNSLVYIQNSTQLKLNKEGHELFMQDVYNAYRRAKTIHAVIRDHTIEEAWWECAETHLRHGYDLEEVWESYEALHPLPQDGAPVSDSKKKLTTFAALTQPTEAGGLQSAYFVSYMPMPGSAEWENRKRKAPARLFNDLVGLAWECSLLNRVRTRLQKEAIGEWISRPLCWLHATDNEVWQIIKRNEITESTVLKIADRRDRRDNPLDTDLSKKIIEATQAEVPRYIRRGMTAEEYLCAVLGYVYHDEMLQPDDPGQIRGYIVRCLQELNLRSWLFSRIGPGRPDACPKRYSSWMRCCDGYSSG